MHFISKHLYHLLLAGVVASACTHMTLYSRSFTISPQPQVLSASIELPMTYPQETDKLDKYFAYRKKISGRLSPLASHSALLVSEAKKYGIDYRLVTAIATIESTQCQATPNRDPYNCWGWGIYPGSIKEPFDDYADGIITVTRGIAKNYHRKGHDTIEEIAAIYNPNTPEAWGGKVQKIYDFIETL